MLEESFDEVFKQSLLDSVSKNESLPMLNTDVYQNYEKTSLDLAQNLEVIAQSDNQSDNQKGKIRIFKTTVKDFLTRPELKAEAFGPASIIIIARDFTEMIMVAKSMEGSLTGSILVSENDKQEASALFPILESKVGRILWNGFPPGVVPGVATHHGGPWPATTDSRYTSIGIQGYKRFVRSICKQGFPDLCGVS